MNLTSSYYNGIQVKKLEFKHGVFYATVVGRREYRVSVVLNNGKIETARCTCPSPYYPCKHMFAVEEAVADLGDKITTPTHKMSTRQMLFTLEKGELLKFIEYLIARNSEIINVAKEFFASKMGGDIVAELIAEFTFIIERFNSLASNAMNYNQDFESLYLDDFAEEIDDLLFRVTNFVKQNKDNPEAAFDLLKSFYDNWAALSKYYIDDSIDSNFAETLISLFLSLPATFDDQLFPILTEILKNNYCFSKQDFTLYLNRFTSPQHRAIQYQCLKDNFQLGSYLLEFRQIAAECNYSEEQVIADILPQRHDCYEIKEYLINYYQNSGDVNNLEKYLIEFEKQEALIDLYQKHQQIEKLKTVLSALMKKCFKLKHYLQMKELFSPSDWLEVRNQFITYGKSAGADAEIYYIENMLPELAAAIDYTSCPPKYLVALFPRYKHSINNVLLEAIKNSEKITSSEQYYFVAEMIERLARFPENNELVKTTLTNLWTSYSKKRPAMMRILDDLFNEYLD